MSPGVKVGTKICPTLFFSYKDIIIYAGIESNCLHIELLVNFFSVPFFRLYRILNCMLNFDKVYLKFYYPTTAMNRFGARATSKPARPPNPEAVASHSITPEKKSPNRKNS